MTDQPNKSERETDFENELFERSKDDRAMIVGSEVRQLIGTIRRLRDAIANRSELTTPLQLELAAAKAALETIVNLDFGRSDDGKDDFYTGAPRFVKAWLIAYDALVKPGEMAERAESLLLANKILDRPNADPDDDLAVLSRQLLRKAEALAAAKDEIERLKTVQFSPTGDNHHNALKCPYCKSGYDKLEAELATLRRTNKEKDSAIFDIRKMLWESHGHSGIYGDDGEMQCSQCDPAWDYKNMPILQVTAAALLALRSRRTHIDAEELVTWLGMQPAWANSYAFIAHIRSLAPQREKL